ncbi:MAG: HAD-IA family hydrolase [bacterium]|nr:HAD-IA family hydrolase [bacterium]
MDGVLVDVGESYRETIQQTVEHFTGTRVTRERIQEYKNQGGWNNDWALSQTIANDLGSDVTYEAVIEVFQELFLGSNGCGLITRERWTPEPGLFERLERYYRLSIFTGRLRNEMEITLRRFAGDIRFDPTVCTREIENTKPAPDGLLKIQGLHPGAELTYIGDTVDDMRCAHAAGVPFIGIASADNPRREELVTMFNSEGAIAVLESVNQLEGTLAQ